MVHIEGVGLVPQLFRLESRQTEHHEALQKKNHTFIIQLGTYRETASVTDPDPGGSVFKSPPRSGSSKGHLSFNKSTANANFS